MRNVYTLYKYTYHMYMAQYMQIHKFSPICQDEREKKKPGKDDILHFINLQTAQQQILSSIFYAAIYIYFTYDFFLLARIFAPNRGLV